MDRATDRDPDAVGAPGPRVLLVGTSLSVAQLCHALKVLDPAPRVLGCVTHAPLSPARVQEAPCAVLGACDGVAEVVRAQSPDLVLVSLPLTMSREVREVTAALERLGVAWRFMPTLGDQLAGRTTSRVTGGLGPTTPGPARGVLAGEAPVDPAQLIARPPRPLDDRAIARAVTDRVVLVTGAGGSIGSELARVVSRYRPARLVLVERAENALFEIDREVARVYPDMPRVAVLHDVTHAARTAELLRRQRPHVVLHAAAHKHVPMMEDHPAEAVENNFYGTRSIADAADAAGVERFVMISSDKAVNPSSVMGATKRLAELYVQHLGRSSQTVFSMVRFGNVLGSACSVLPIWTEQLARGGPITVTHPQMTRYFMTIPEAAGLVLQAGAIARGGEVFLLDMGEPVRIADLAARFLRLQGFEPGADIAVQITGIRPGEKLFETLAYDGEDMAPTPHEAIRIWRTTPPTPAAIQTVVSAFDRLRRGRGDAEHPWAGIGRETIVNALRASIPEMVAAAAV